MADLQQLRKGSTPLLILSVLKEGPMHGYAIMRELEARSDGYFNMNAALLYPTLHEMERDGLLHSQWEEGSGARRRKVYQITKAGVEQYNAGQQSWRLFFEHLFRTLGESTGRDPR